MLKFKIGRILFVLTCLAGILFLWSCSNPTDGAEAPSGVSENQAEEESKVEGDASTELDKDMPMSAAQARKNADAIYEEFDHRLPNARLIPTQTIVREMVSGFIERRFAENQPDLTMFVGASFVWGYPLAEKYTLTYQYQVHSQRPTVNYSIYGASSVWIYSMLCMLENRKARPSRLILSVPYTNDVGRLVRNLEFEKGVQYADDVIASLYSCGDHHKKRKLTGRIFTRSDTGTIRLNDGAQA